MLAIKRIYEPPVADDGYRVLVDRLWPRGLSKEKAAIDLWLKDIAPTPELREWFNHDPKRYEEFAARYEKELVHNQATEQLREIIRNNDNVTLLYAAHSPEVNHANVLLHYLVDERD